MYGSYLLDKNRWPLVFDCVKAMTTALKEKKNSCDVNKRRNKMNDAEEENSDKREDKSKSDNTELMNGKEVGEEEKEEKEDDEENSIGIPLLCKIRICEDGVDSYKATEDFCRGTVSYRTVRYGLLHIFFYETL
jgi:soluble cytochrome b562